MVPESLAQLRDIHLPKPIGLWPMAPAWYVLAGLLMLMVIGGIYYVRLKQQRGRAKREALRLLSEYEQQLAAGQTAATVAAQVSDVLRRVALVYFPRQEVAGLQGQVWVDFLDKTAGAPLHFKTNQTLLLDLPFQKEGTNADLQPLFANARAWIKQRGRPCSN